METRKRCRTASPMTTTTGRLCCDTDDSTRSDDDACWIRRNANPVDKMDHQVTTTQQGQEHFPKQRPREQQRRRWIGSFSVFLLLSMTRTCIGFHMMLAPSPQTFLRNRPGNHPPRTLATVLFDSERQMNVHLPSLSSNTLRNNGTSVEIVTEAQFLSELSQSSTTTTSSSTSPPSTLLENPHQLPLDVPLPTESGGFTHTRASKAKISAANKGKTPWNKGRQRSPEERAKIAAGVRAKNRERFLKKLDDMGITEEEYNEKKNAERRKKDAERRARKTENGGYRLTAETKKKISQVLKQKFASGEIKRKKVDPSKVRRGFVHSEETRRKISEALKKRWANDEEYRENMILKTTMANTRADVRERISKTLKKKWQDPEYRREMTEKMSKHKSDDDSTGMTHREKISEAMKRRWQDSEYRQKVVDSMARRSEELAKLRPPPKPRAKSRPKPAAKKVVAKPVRLHSASTHNGAHTAAPTRGNRQLQPKPSQPASANQVRGVVVALQPNTLPHKKAAKKKKKVKAKSSSSKSATQSKKNSSTKAKKVRGAADEEGDDSEAPPAAKSRKNGTGSVTQLRKERRDLYDLLYGDDEGSASENPSRLATVFDLGDENLDTFDPYGLDDF